MVRHPASPERDNSSFVLARLRLQVAEAAEAERLPPERDLAAELGVGRRAVRRALEVLEAEGRIWRRQGKGTFIGPEPPRESGGLAGELVQRTNPLEVLQARACLEPALARLAATRATPQDAERLRGLCARLETASDADAKELWDGALHRAIARLAGNRLLLELFELVEEVRHDEAWRAIRERARSETTGALYIRQHRRIVDALAAHDPQGAESAMREHIAALRRNTALLAEEAQPAPPAERVDGGETAHAG